MAACFFISQDVNPASRPQRMRSPPGSPTMKSRSPGVGGARRKPGNFVSSREVVSRCDFGAPQLSMAPLTGRRSTKSPPPPSARDAPPSQCTGSTSVGACGATRSAESRPAHRELQARRGGGPVREEVAMETLRVVESALLGVQSALRRSGAPGADQPVHARSAEHLPGLPRSQRQPRVSLGTQLPLNPTAVVEATAKAVAAANAACAVRSRGVAGTATHGYPVEASAAARSPSVESGPVAEPLPGGAAKQVSSLAAARESHKARVGAAERSARFTNGLLEKIEGIRDGVSLISDASTSGPESSCGSTPAQSPIQHYRRVPCCFPRRGVWDFVVG